MSLSRTFAATLDLDDLVGPFHPSAPELAVLRTLAPPVRLGHHAPWSGPPKIPVDEDHVLAWLRTQVHVIDDRAEHTAALCRLMDEKLEHRLLCRITRDDEGEKKARAALRRLAKVHAVEPAPFLEVPPWFDAMIGTSSRRRQARVYAEVPPDAGIVERVVAARGLLETAKELRMDDVGASITEVAPTLERLAGDDVGYVRLLALTACEWLVRIADGDPAAGPLRAPLDAARVAWR